jgi:CHAT domain-containing protein/tetratricopeptide (TPR) repeat protein
MLENLISAAEPAGLEAQLQATADAEDAVSRLLSAGQARIATSPAIALRCSRLASVVAESRGDLAGAVAAHRQSAQALRLQGLHEEALVEIALAVARAEQLGDPRLAAQVQVGAVDSLAWMTRFDEAVALAKRLEEQLLALGAEEDAAKVVVNVANQYFRRDQYEQALERYGRALDVLARFGDPVTVARVQANAANALTAMGRIDDALLLYQEARRSLEERNDPGAATIDGNEGYLQYVSGKHALALAAMLRCRESYALRGLSVVHANVNADLAAVYRDLNLRPEALDCYEQTLAMLEGRGIGYERARAEMGRAATIAAESPAEALAGLDRAEQMFRAQNNTLQLAHVRLVRSYLLRALQRNDEARAEALRAERTFTRRGQRGWTAEARYLIADIDLENGIDARRRMQAVARTARRHARGWLECRAHRSLGRYLAPSRQAEALKQLRAGVAALEAARTLIAPEDLHVSFTRDKLDIYDDIVRILLARGRRKDVIEALETVERSRSRLVLERIQSVVDGLRIQADIVPQEMQERLLTLRAELSRAYHEIHTAEPDNPRRLVHATAMTNLGSLEQAYLNVLRDIQLANLSSNTPALTMTPVAPEVKLREALGTHESLVEYYAVGGDLCAFILTRERTVVRYGIASMEEVTNAARRLRYHLKKLEMASGYVDRHRHELRSAVIDVLGTLYKLVLEPIEDLLQATRLVLVPYGVLHGLPFHAFYDGSLYAVDRWEIIYAPSASIWYAGARRAQRRAQTPPQNDGCALLMALPGPGTERVSEEVEHIAALEPCARVFHGADATLDAFRTWAGRSARIHLATHAMYRTDNALFSGLRLSDGWLLARDLYDISLHCDLATLSACHTGVTTVEAGDELFGLIRGFLCAGAQSLAASLWPADDCATTKLMMTFYRLLAQGVGKADALRQAQREVRGEHPHPYYWAAFALFGER